MMMMMMMMMMRWMYVYWIIVIWNNDFSLVSLVLVVFPLLLSLLVTHYTHCDPIHTAHSTLYTLSREWFVGLVVRVSHQRITTMRQSIISPWSGDLRDTYSHLRLNAGQHHNNNTINQLIKTIHQHNKTQIEQQTINQINQSLNHSIYLNYNTTLRDICTLPSYWMRVSEHYSTIHHPLINTQSINQTYVCCLKIR